MISEGMIMNQSVYVTDTMITCGEWCKGQYYSFHIQQLLIIPVFVVVISSLSYVLEKKKSWGKLEFWKERILDAVNILTRVLMIGYIIQLMSYL
jgi:hypothetical protein